MDKLKDFKTEFDKSFIEVDPETFVAEMEELGYVFVDIKENQKSSD